MPNPFSEYATIHFELNKATNLMINVYNSNGKRVTTLINTFKQEGMHQMFWNTSQIAPGIYFIEFLSGQASRESVTVVKF
ncbi:MAG: T9SS type A sorting domain-containing protein [Bacteroidales bacterium]|nr:T9SS type A sorting domain-containing protein [Bacteroidales bacterium]